MSSPPLHPATAALSPLLGVWTGQGQGLWVSDPAFGYREESSFTPTGKPFLIYQQRTFALDDARPLHAETGYLRVVTTHEAPDTPAPATPAPDTPAPGTHPPNVADSPNSAVDVELVLVQPTGFAEIHAGSFRAGQLQLSLVHLTRTPTALAVTAIQRSWWVGADSLEYLVRIAMNDEPITDHLRAKLSRTS